MAVITRENRDAMVPTTFETNNRSVKRKPKSLVEFNEAIQGDL
jgi:hypothetical protein